MRPRSSIVTSNKNESALNIVWDVFLLEPLHPRWMSLRRRYEPQAIRAGSHGIPSPTHVNKSQHGGRVRAFEPQEPVNLYGLCGILSILDYSMQKHSWELCPELRLAFCLT